MMHHHRLTLLCISIICLVITSCKTDTSSATTDEVDEVVIRITEAPESLSPMHTNSSYAREVYQYLFTELAAYDYETLELKPILITEIPSQEIIERDGEKLASYTMRIKDSAEWATGQPITGYDVDFTFKIPTLPAITHPGWRQIPGIIESVEVDPKDPKQFAIITKDLSERTLEVLVSVQPYPAYLGDPDGRLKTTSLSDLKDLDNLKDKKVLEAIGTNFNKIFTSDEVVGAGPYSLERRETGQYLILKQKDNYWGEAYPEIDQLESLPDRIVYRQVKDDATATTLLKNGEIDFIDMSKGTYQIFKDMKDDPQLSQRFNFLTPTQPRYLQLLLNNGDKRLADIEVRRAISHLTDVDRIMSQILGGYGQRMTSPVMPHRSYFNADIKAPQFDIAMANEILDKAGWIDQDNDGVREKVINGLKEKLVLRFHYSGSSLGTAITNIIKEDFAQAGIQVDLIIKPSRTTISENLKTGDYELFVTVASVFPTRDDFYGRYHSNSIGTGGRNYSAYKNPEVDKLIEEIRANPSIVEQDEAFRKMQKLIMDDVAVIMLYSPQMRIVTTKNIQPILSKYTPFYFVNAAVED